MISETLRQKCGWHPMLGLPVGGVKTIEEYKETAALNEDDIVLFSLVYTSLTAKSLLARKVTLNKDFIEWVTTRARETVVFSRRDLIDHLVEKKEEETWQIYIKDQATLVKDFRGMYKLVQTLLTTLEF